MLTELGMLNLKPPKACGEILKFYPRAPRILLSRQAAFEI